VKKIAYGAILLFEIFSRCKSGKNSIFIAKTPFLRMIYAQKRSFVGYFCKDTSAVANKKCHDTQENV